MEKTLKLLKNIQKNEITEHFIYASLAKRITDPHNREILEKIANDERRHFDMIGEITGVKPDPSRLKIGWYVFLSRVFGITFGLKLMEKGESVAATGYGDIVRYYPQLEVLILDEQRHEENLLDMIQEERIAYASSIVLGLNDALVELTGALAGLTFALQNGKIIAITGLITGIAASLSMAASDYLSTKEEDSSDGADEGGKNPLKAALYTGIAYIITVLILVSPYLLIENVFVALPVMLALTVTIVFLYTFYISVAKRLNFWHRFLEMAGISLGVAVISFGIGKLINMFFDISL